MTKKKVIFLGSCIISLAVGGCSSVEPEPVVTSGATVLSQSCKDMLATSAERDKLMSKYQSEVVAQLQDVPDQLSSATSQSERNDIQTDLIAIERSNIHIQVKLFENAAHMKTVKALCLKGA